MAATVASPERLLMMTTLKSVENGEDFLFSFSLLLVLMVTAAQGRPWPWWQVAFAYLNCDNQTKIVLGGKNEDQPWCWDYCSGVVRSW